MKLKNYLYIVLTFLITLPYTIMAQAQAPNSPGNPGGAGSGAAGARPGATGYAAGWWWFWGIVLLIILALIIWYLARTPTDRQSTGREGPRSRGTTGYQGT